ncbi:hypothetical protein BKA69DRAFT_1077526 [Paraphysoderma sedebokerense]|nr:hypothetical protein BKA69DRAFT_1077526 [Paraphysoderma sedebokerense]
MANSALPSLKSVFGSNSALSFLTMVADLTDIHCHVTQLDRTSLPTILSRCRQAGIYNIIAVSETIDDAPNVIELAKSFGESQEKARIFAGVGLHPVQNIPSVSDASHAESQQKTFRTVILADVPPMIKFIKRHSSKLVCIGEIGLDYSPHILSSPFNPPGYSQDEIKSIQKDVFKSQIEVSQELNLPLNIHSRSAGHHAISTLRECNQIEYSAVLHAFDGNVKYALAGVQHGYMFSVPPSIVRSDSFKKLVKNVPLTHLLLETDAPALGPTKGTDNTPENLIVSLKEVAKVKGVSMEIVNQMMVENTAKVFGARMQVRT